MKMLIDKNKKLNTIQNEFEKIFPFLKIEFYKRAHSQGEGSAKKNTLDVELTIGEVQKKNASGTIEIHKLMTVAELESAFTEVFGLAVQVFRKSGKVWLQTTTTDDWTLAEQDQRASEKVATAEENIIDSMDRQELE
ncbi:MAG: hypothetical protein HUU48_07250 [Flavobacteriales bacterium]|nr:hypothetical protein [Flavobacteriales bacterium]